MTMQDESRLLSRTAAQRVVVTGASGFIGRALVDHLHRAGHQVVALSRSRVNHSEAVQSVIVSSYQDHAVAVALSSAQAVVHLAAVAHRTVVDNGANDGLFESNVVDTANLASLSAAAHVRRFLFISSIGVNGSRTENRPFTESDSPCPTEPYARSKWRCEKVLREVAQQSASMEFVIIRPPLVYGPGAPGNFRKLWRSVSRKALLPLGCIDNRRSFVGLDNLLDLIELCLCHPNARNELFLVSDGEDLSTRELVKRMAHALDVPSRLVSVPLPLLRLIALLSGHGDQLQRLVASLQVDINKARTQLGWLPMLTLDEGLQRVAAYERIRSALR